MSEQKPVKTEFGTIEPDRLERFTGEVELADPDKVDPALLTAHLTNPKAPDPED